MGRHDRSRTRASGEGDARGWRIKRATKKERWVRSGVAAARAGKVRSLEKPR